MHLVVVMMMVVVVVVVVVVRGVNVHLVWLVGVGHQLERAHQMTTTFFGGVGVWGLKRGASLRAAVSLLLGCRRRCRKSKWGERGKEGRKGVERTRGRNMSRLLTILCRCDAGRARTRRRRRKRGVMDKQRMNV